MNAHEDQIEVVPRDDQPVTPQVWRRRVLCGRCRYEIAGLTKGGRCPECGAVNLDTIQINSHCTQARYILLAIPFGLIGVHNFAAHRYRAGLVQMIMFLVAVVSLFSFAFLLVLLLVPCLVAWVFVEVLTVKYDGHGRWMPPARHKARGGNATL